MAPVHFSMAGEVWLQSSCDGREQVHSLGWEFPGFTYPGTFSSSEFWFPRFTHSQKWVDTYYIYCSGRAYAEHCLTPEDSATGIQHGCCLRSLRSTVAAVKVVLKAADVSSSENRAHCCYNEESKISRWGVSWLKLWLASCSRSKTPAEGTCLLSPECCLVTAVSQADKHQEIWGMNATLSHTHQPLLQVSYQMG